MVAGQGEGQIPTKADKTIPAANGHTKPSPILQDILLSARWDEDGSASTRGPNDLVGRAEQKVGKPPSVSPLASSGLHSISYATASS